MRHQGSNTRAEAHQKASGAYGSELAYSTSTKHQPGARPLKQMLVNEEELEEDEEEFEEETEEEMEEEEDVSSIEPLKP